MSVSWRARNAFIFNNGLLLGKKSFPEHLKGGVRKANRNLHRKKRRSCGCNHHPGAVDAGGWEKNLSYKLPVHPPTPPKKLEGMDMYQQMMGFGKMYVYPLSNGGHFGVSIRQIWGRGEGGKLAKTT